jgi:hypothetical protein
VICTLGWEVGMGKDNKEKDRGRGMKGKRREERG